MNQHKKQFACKPVVTGIVMVLLSIFILAAAKPSSAATTKKKAPAVERMSVVDYTEARIKMLQTAIKVTPEQQGVWSNLTLVMRDNAKELDNMIKDKSELTKNMTALEAMKFHSQVTESRLEQQKKLIPVFESLYTSMSDEQKKITDTIFRTGKHGKHKLN